MSHTHLCTFTVHPSYCGTVSDTAVRQNIPCPKIKQNSMRKSNENKLSTTHHAILESMIHADASNISSDVQQCPTFGVDNP